MREPTKAVVEALYPLTDEDDLTTHAEAWRNAIDTALAEDASGQS